MEPSGFPALWRYMENNVKAFITFNIIYIDFGKLTNEIQWET
jgi:hypothetical protein